VSPQREGLTILFAAVNLVFLIACTNVAVLILVRATEGTQAIAIRAALGASRSRLVFARLYESLLLSLAGGLLGLILTKESLPLIASLWPTDVSFISKLTIDGRVVLFTFAISVASTLLFGLLPALKLSHVNIAEILAHTSRTASAHAEHVRALRLLVGGQMALTIMLLAGTMLLVKSLINLYSVPLGFDYRRAAIAQVSLAGEKYSSSRATDQLLDQIIKRLKALPGIRSAAAVDGLPLGNGLNLPLHPVAIPRSLDHADEYRPVSPEYFSALSIPLRSGRFFNANDTTGSAPVAIVNETLALHWWPGRSAIGSYIMVDQELGPQPSDLPRQIVGVVADIHEKGPGVPAPPTMFVPLSQTPDNINAFFNKAFLTSIVIRADNQMDILKQARHAIQSVDPDLPLASFSCFDQIVARSTASSRVIALLTAIFSSFALLLTVVGMHGLLNYQGHLRRGEIAVRIAVGASRVQVVRILVRQGSNLVFFALAAGLAGSFIVERLLARLLYNVQSYSLIVIVGTGLLVGLLATLISFLTAIRAASHDPMAVLRNE
jgi:putative ABC transport system permease protein